MLLGEAPGPRGGNEDPLGKRTAKRLCDFAGWMPEMDGEDPYRAALAKRFELRNLLDHRLERAGKGTRFPVPEARRAARRLDVRGRTVVVLGKRVALAMGAPTEYFVIETTAKGVTFVTLPHPSGINMALNDPRTRKMAGLILRTIARYGGNP